MICNNKDCEYFEYKKHNSGCPFLYCYHLYENIIGEINTAIKNCNADKEIYLNNEYKENTKLIEEIQYILDKHLITGEIYV